MRNTKNIIVAFSLIMISLVFAEPFAEYKDGKEYIVDSIFPFDEPIIDGLSVDDIWELGHEITDFVQAEPIRLSSPSQRTSFKFKYGKDALYIYARMFDISPDSIKKRVVRRDDWERGFDDQSDWISIERFKNTK